MVGAAEEEISSVEVKAIQREVGEFQGAEGGVSHDGMAFGEEAVQGTGQAIIVEFFGRNVPEDVGSMIVSPIGYVHQGVGFTETSGE